MRRQIPLIAATCLLLAAVPSSDAAVFGRRDRLKLFKVRDATKTNFNEDENTINTSHNNITKNVLDEKTEKSTENSMFLLKEDLENTQTEVTVRDDTTDEAQYARTEAVLQDEAPITKSAVEEKNEFKTLEFNSENDTQETTERHAVSDEPRTDLGMVREDNIIELEEAEKNTEKDLDTVTEIYKSNQEVEEVGDEEGTQTEAYTETDVESVTALHFVIAREGSDIEVEEHTEPNDITESGTEGYSDKLSDETNANNDKSVEVTTANVIVKSRHANAEMESLNNQKNGSEDTFKHTSLETETESSLTKSNSSVETKLPSLHLSTESPDFTTEINIIEKLPEIQNELTDLTVGLTEALNTTFEAFEAFESIFSGFNGLNDLFSDDSKFHEDKLIGNDVNKNKEVPSVQKHDVTTDLPEKSTAVTKITTKISHEKDENTEKPLENTDESKPFKAFVKLNITICAHDKNADDTSKVVQNITLDELMDELNITSSEIETSFEELTDVLADAVNTTLEAFGSIFNGALDVITAPRTDIRPLISVNTNEGGPVNIPGIFSVNTNRRDGALLSIEDGEKTKIRIPGVLHLQVGGEDPVNSKRDNHLFKVTAANSGARIQAPFLDIQFGDTTKVQDHDVILS